jgi:hypothetical protein
MRATWLFAAVLLVGCSANVVVDTAPVSEVVPVTSLAQPIYAEVALDIPSEAQGAADVVTVNEISADMTVVNTAQRTTLALGMRLSFTGQATPGNDVIYADFNKPSYFDQSIPILTVADYLPGTSTPVHISNPALVETVQHSRVYLIVSNTVTNLGLGENLPIQIQLNGIVLHADVTKDFSGLQSGTALGGL